ncbi:MAG: hydrogenase expression/formation protein HypE [Coriobacteriia bacterium]|nr:hydrogenase expression/formation protein HypE [Coriobacteriia bacterium]
MTDSFDAVQLAHGSGGSLMRALIEEIIAAEFSDVQLEDAATLSFPEATGAAADLRLSFSTDTFVVHPLFFPGGDIGHIAVCGTVNDVATAGAIPRYLSVGFVLEEGLPIDDLKRILRSMCEVAREAGVALVTGDTKVVGRGQGDGIFINTTGIGVIRPGLTLSASSLQAGDKILLSGSLGDHGICIVSVREGLQFGTDITTDAAPLAGLIASVLDAAPHTRCFRDPTRGGLASTLNEIADSSGVAMVVSEDAVPVHDQVRGACEMLGYDVFQVANEGKMVAFVPAEEADAALAAMRANTYGAEAAIIGEVVEGAAGRVALRNTFGATRIMDTLVGEQLPRIC